MSFKKSSALDKIKAPPSINTIQNRDINGDCWFTFKKGYGPDTTFKIFRLIKIIA